MESTEKGTVKVAVFNDKYENNVQLVEELKCPYYTIQN